MLSAQRELSIPQESLRGHLQDMQEQLKMRVLLVDDERELISTIAERLRIRGMDVRVSVDGPSAIRMIDDVEPEVMVLDLRISGIDGFELLRRVKESHPATQVIVTIWYGSQKDRETAMRLGAVKYFPKPLDIDELIKALALACGHGTKHFTG
jgi:two-component system, OmpR family, response regulator CpxR